MAPEGIRFEVLELSLLEEVDGMSAYVLDKADIDRMVAARKRTNGFTGDRVLVREVAA